jgi:hypothetical protein
MRPSATGRPGLPGPATTGRTSPAEVATDPDLPHPAPVSHPGFLDDCGEFTARATWAPFPCTAHTVRMPTRRPGSYTWVS